MRDEPRLDCDQERRGWMVGSWISCAAAKRRTRDQDEEQRSSANLGQREGDNGRTDLNERGHTFPRLLGIPPDCASLAF